MTYNPKELKGKDLIAYRAAGFFKDGDTVNLGIGMPTLCLNYLREGVDVMVDSENGVVGLIGAPKAGEIADPNIVDAGGKASMLRVGGACFDSFRSFGFIRGGHIDACVLGAYEVDAEGNLANWKVPGKAAAGMGGAMDLVTGAKITIVMSTHFDKDGNCKIVRRTDMPLTGYHCVDYIVTELGCFQVVPEGLKLLETAPGVTVEELVEKTPVALIIPETVGCMA